MPAWLIPLLIEVGRFILKRFFDKDKKPEAASNVIHTLRSERKGLEVK